MSEHNRRDTNHIRRRGDPRTTLRDGVIIGTTQALILLLIIFGLTIFTGNQQQRSLNDIRSSARAQVCVLILPVGPEGRDEGAVNSLCLIPNGIQPVDANGDGMVETQAGR